MVMDLIHLVVRFRALYGHGFDTSGGEIQGTLLQTNSHMPYLTL